MAKRPFRKLKGVSKANDEFAIANDRRPFVFGVTLSDGGTLQCQGSVRPDQCKRLVEIFVELNNLHIGTNES